MYLVANEITGEVMLADIAHRVFLHRNRSGNIRLELVSVAATGLADFHPKQGPVLFSDGVKASLAFLRRAFLDPMPELLPPPPPPPDEKPDTKSGNVGPKLQIAK